MSAANHTTIIDCIRTKGVEFFAMEENVVRAFHDGQVLKFDQLPAFAYSTIKGLMNNHSATMTEMEVFAYQRWGGMDNELDIDEHGVPSGPEFVPGYSDRYDTNGQVITGAQMRVLKLIHLDNKLIAESLHMSPHTVARHVQAMFVGTGSQSRTELALWAINKGII